jgi:hypothetical protein
MILTSIPNHLQKSRKTNGGKASAIKSRKNTKAPQKKLLRHQSTSEKPPSHQSTLENITKLLQKKPPSHESTTEKTVGTQSSNPVQPPKLKKPPTIKKWLSPSTKGS